MKCPDVEALILERLTEDERRALPADAEAHVASCASCRAARDEYSRLWERLGQIPVPEPSDELYERFQRRLAAQANAPLRQNRWQRGPIVALRIAAVLAAAFLGGLAGYALGVRRPAADVGAAAPMVESSPTYMLLLRDGTIGPVAPERSEVLIAEYTRWARRLAASGRLVQAEKLEDEGRILAPGDEGGRVARLEPASEERVGGFFIVRAADVAEATRIALESPHLRHGGVIELRQVERSR